jgi:hypothetical protein
VFLPWSKFKCWMICRCWMWLLLPVFGHTATFDLENKPIASVLLRNQRLWPIESDHSQQHQCVR